MGPRSPRSLIALQVLEQAVVQGKKVLPDPNSSCLPFLDCTALQFITYDREKKNAVFQCPRCARLRWHLGTAHLLQEVVHFW